MKSIRFAFGSFLFLAIFANASMAQVQRTFVSGLGNDGNPCSRTAPCRTFPQALMGTSAGGEIIVLDSAGYGPLTGVNSINKSVSIIASAGVYAGISVFSGDGITINAGASDTVILRGLTVNNQGSTGNGIVFNSGGTLHIENCVASGFNLGQGGASGLGIGIRIAGPGNIFVNDTIAKGNGDGMTVFPTAGTAVFVMDRLRLDANASGGLSIFASGSGTKVHAAIRNSSISGNAGVGVAVGATSGNEAFLDIENCLLTNNAYGINPFASGSGSAVASISNCTITHSSAAGFLIGSGTIILTRGNNTISPPNVGTLTPLPAQ